MWYLRGNEKARVFIEKHIPFSVSMVTYMELVQGMKNKNELRAFQKTFQRWGVNIIQIDEEAFAHSMFDVQEYALSHSMTLSDGLIAATAVQNSEVLVTANDRHCKRFDPE
ncbi:MAG TPA: VapC toxin family PIN domain ribonuclease [Spirochaetaceae bacterium]|nr:VapC toxin family PIN domain ribonuclease [Spirochaetaceae bacterium]